MIPPDRHRLIDALALAGLAALTLTFFWKIALTNQVLAGLDLFAYFYPLRDFVSEALREGRLPLWNPYLFMGAPLLANSQAAVLYPLHWPLVWLSVPKQIAWSIVLHIWIAGAGTYLFARRALRLDPLPALVSALVFALGGFLGAQVEHINQLNASVWLPWLLLCLENALAHGRWRWMWLLGGCALVSLMLLAGHTQAAYIVLVGAAAYAALRGLIAPGPWSFGGILRRFRALGLLALMAGVGLVLAAGQLVPTLELAGLSVRSGGLAYREAVAFSLKPSLVFKAFLPPVLWEPPFSEYVAYVGLVGLGLALVGMWSTVRQWRHARREGAALPLRVRLASVLLVLAVLGVFLAFGVYNPAYYLLYKVVPVFDLFRVPARWLLLYGFGASLLAGIGMQAVALSKPWKWATVLLLILELFVAGQRLAYGTPTAPAAFDSMRTAPAHILADLEPGLHRFLSISDIQYDPGDMADLEAMYGASLSEVALYDLIVATKLKEVLAYNLPLRYRIFSVDGYDGGLLPIRDYVDFERLFLAEDEIWPDGRLRQQLERIPPARLLSLLNVKYAITDKVEDVWIDDVFYDLEHTVALGAMAIPDPPSFEATHLGVVSYLSGAAAIPDGTPVATIVLTNTAVSTVSLTLNAGDHTSESSYDQGETAHRQARIGHLRSGPDTGNDYIAVLHLPGATRSGGLAVRSLLPEGTGAIFHLRGLSLIDERTGTGRTLSVDPAFRLAHSGDVKVYENLQVLPRTFVVHEARFVDDVTAALTLVQDPSFDPSREVVLSGEDDGSSSERAVGPEEARIIAYEPEELEIHATLSSPGYLVLSDTDYPGWSASVDGEPRQILRANLYFRALALDAGSHEIAFRFEPRSVQTGITISQAAWLGWVLLVAIAALRTGRRAAGGV